MTDRAAEHDFWVMGGPGVGQRIRVRRGDPAGPQADAVRLNETGEGQACLAFPRDLSAACQGLALAAAYQFLRPARPWPSPALTFLTPAGPRCVQRRGGLVFVEYPAPLLWRSDADRGVARELVQGLDLGAGLADPCFLSLDGVALAAAVRGQEPLLRSCPGPGLGRVLRQAGCRCLVLWTRDRTGLMLRSWSDSGQEQASPLAAGAAACVAAVPDSRELVRFPVSRQQALVRLLGAGDRVQRVRVGLEVR